MNSTRLDKKLEEIIEKAKGSICFIPVRKQEESTKVVEEFKTFKNDKKVESESE